jgi:hypothetical protein
VTVLCLSNFMNLLSVVSENRYADKQMTRHRDSTFLIHISSLCEPYSENVCMGLKSVFGCSVAENSLELLHPVFLYALCDPSLPPNLPMACRQHVWMLLLKTSFRYETKDFLLKMLSWLQVSIFILLRNMGYNFKLQYFLDACGTNVRKQIFLFTIPYCRSMFNCRHCMQCHKICQLHLHISPHICFKLTNMVRNVLQKSAHIQFVFYSITFFVLLVLFFTQMFGSCQALPVTLPSGC